MKKGDKLTTVSPFGIVHIKKYSDYTLMNMRKDELVRYIRMVESNYESLNIQYENAVNANLEKFADFEKVIRCKDCRYFETDHWERVNEIPLIVAHEICTRWGGGCKTAEDGYCFMAERKEENE